MNLKQPAGQKKNKYLAKEAEGGLAINAHREDNLKHRQNQSVCAERGRMAPGTGRRHRTPDPAGEEGGGASGRHVYGEVVLGDRGLWGHRPSTPIPPPQDNVPSSRESAARLP